MRVFSYIVAYDSGYSPNPFHGFCTLACCKPVIRRHAQVGDIIIGLTPKARGHRLVYAMRVAERLTFDQYWHDPRFRPKRPRMSSASAVDWSGDNHYEPIGNGRFKQRPSRHSHDDGAEDRHAMSHDLGADRGNPVLVGTDYAYFGTKARRLPDEFSFLAVRRGHRSTFTKEQVRFVCKLLDGLSQGVHASPHLWPGVDDSWLRYAKARPSRSTGVVPRGARCRVVSDGGCSRPCRSLARPRRRC